jgi:hypothetical protein
MKVKIEDEWFDSNEFPIMLKFNGSSKDQFINLFEDLEEKSFDLTEEKIEDIEIKINDMWFDSNEDSIPEFFSDKEIEKWMKD